MANWEDLLDDVLALKCPTCDGLGEYDDAEPGDISFNTVKCSPCKGTGFKDGQTRQLDPVPVGS